MIKPEQIPKEVVAEFLRCLSDEGIEYTFSQCIAAAINAWPGAWGERNPASEWISLPLPEEKNDG